jgi:hypothetical protein
MVARLRELPVNLIYFEGTQSGRLRRAPLDGQLRTETCLEEAAGATPLNNHERKRSRPSSKDNTNFYQFRQHNCCFLFWSTRL